MKLLIACEKTGKIRDEFVKNGHFAISCDLQNSDTYGLHYQGDVRDILYEKWDLIIAHPPCTYLANSGVQHLHKDKTRWKKLEEARKFFMLFYNHPCKRICIENPVPHKYAKLPDYSQLIHPYYFGDPFMKKTCLWLKGLPILMCTKITNQGEKYIGKDGKSNGSKWYQLCPCKERSDIRSKTFQGIARAMADQWDY